MRRAKPLQKIEGSLSGVLREIRFHQANFLIGVLDDGTTVKGNLLSPQVGLEYAFKGRWERHPRWGEQFAFTDYRASYPTDLAAVRAYLVENCKWIGPQVSKRLVDAYGKDTLKVCKESPERVAAEIQGLTIRRAKEIAAMLRNNEANENLQLALKDIFGGTRVSRRAVGRIIEKWGQDAPAQIRENPYTLIEAVDGIGFLTADDVARKVGYDFKGGPRIRAGILHTLKEQANSKGHTCLPGKVLLGEAGKILGVSVDRIEAELAPLEKDGFIVTADGFIYLKGYYEDEKLIAEKLKVLARQTLPSGQPVFDGLADDQKEALEKAVTSGVFILTGAPGTGKTFTIKRIISSFPDARVALAAPTGKASKRIYEQSGMKALTIHKLLEPQKVGGRFVFTRGHDNPLEVDLIVLDECFDYKQPILTEDGWRYIGVVVNNRKAIRVWSRNPGNGLLELKPIIRWIKKPAPQKILKISAGRSESMRVARIIRCTPDHKVLTPYGYRRAGDLCIGEEVIVHGYQLTSEQRSILIGSLLGDGSMNAKNGRTSPQIVITHGENQREYLEFKQRALGVLAGKIQRGNSGYTNRSVWRLAVNVVDETYEIAQEMIISGRHPSGRKRWTPTDRFLEWIDEQALAVWYLDNGSLHRRHLAGGRVSYDAAIHSQRFSQRDNQRLAEYLYSRFGLNPVVTPDGKGNYFLRFRKEDTDRLLKIVRQYTPACMAYKLDSESDYTYEPATQVDTTIARIQTIEEVKPYSAYVFDIEVADNHNYVAGNILVSNCSMIDTTLMARFLEAVAPGTRLVLVGDTYQLPSVGPGNILKDLIASKAIPSTELTIIKRQDEGLIIRNCHRIKNGEDIELGNSTARDFFFLKRDDEESIRETILDLVSRRFPESYKADPLREVQVITPLREKTALSCKALNAEFQRRINPKPKVEGCRFKVGDKVIQTKNEYDKDIINGDIGYVLDINKKGRSITVAFENPERTVELPLYENDLELAYAITCHKFQGSEARIIVIPVHRCFGPLIFQRNWIYTGVSRAKEVCVLVGQRDELTKAIRRNQQQRRHTRLACLLGRQAEMLR
jgi:ATP-dependent exoDNAse (exonuclease V) alpha subunit